jgi:hypothetical protein
MRWRRRKGSSLSNEAGSLDARHGGSTGPITAQKTGGNHRRNIDRVPAGRRCGGQDPLGRALPVAGGSRKNVAGCYSGAPESAPRAAIKTPSSTGLRPHDHRETPATASRAAGVAKDPSKSRLGGHPHGASPGSQVLAPQLLSRSARLRAKPDTWSVGRGADEFDAGSLQGGLDV